MKKLTFIFFAFFAGYATAQSELSHDVLVTQRIHNGNEQYSFFGQTPRNTGIEYAMGDTPDSWKELGGGNLKFTNGFTYIYLDKPAPGKKIEVLLR